MTKGKSVEAGVKSVIIDKIRDEGMRVVEASAHYQVSSKSIYRWLREGVVQSEANLVLENNRLKRELEQVYNLLGRATVELKRPKR